MSDYFEEDGPIKSRRLSTTDVDPVIKVQMSIRTHSSRDFLFTVLKKKYKIGDETKICGLDFRWRVHNIHVLSSPYLSTS